MSNLIETGDLALNPYDPRLITVAAQRWTRTSFSGYPAGEPGSSVFLGYLPALRELNGFGY